MPAISTSVAGRTSPGSDSFSVAQAHHPIGSVLELVNLFRVFGFESFVHHITNAV